MIKDHSENAGAPANETMQRVATKLLCGNVLLQAGLSQLLSGTCFDVPGSASSGPDLCIVDATGDFQQALDLVRETKALHPATRIVVIANQFAIPAVQSAVDAGVDSFCLGRSVREVLIRTL